MKRSISNKSYLKWISEKNIRFIILEKTKEELNKEFIIFYNFSYFSLYKLRNKYMREIKINTNSEIIILGRGKYMGKNIEIQEKLKIKDHPIFDDEEQCIEAIKRDWIIFFDIKKRTKKINKEAVKQNWELLEYIADADDYVYDEAIKQNGNALKYIPQEKQTKQLCIKAIVNNLNALNYVKKPLGEIQITKYYN